MSDVKFIVSVQVIEDDKDHTTHFVYAADSYEELKDVMVEVYESVGHHLWRPPDDN